MAVPSWSVSSDETLPTSQFSPEFPFDVDRDELPQHVRNGRNLSLGQCVVLLRRQVDDAPKVRRLRVRSADRVFDVKQGLMATGPKGPAVLAHKLRPAEKQDPGVPGTQVDLFQNLPVGVSLPARCWLALRNRWSPSVNVVRPHDWPSRTTWGMYRRGSQAFFSSASHSSERVSRTGSLRT